MTEPTDLLKAGFRDSRVDWIRQALNEGADPNHVFDLGTPDARMALEKALPIHFSLREDILTALLRHGADPNAPMRGPDTAGTPFFLHVCTLNNVRLPSLIMQEATVPIDWSARHQGKTAAALLVGLGPVVMQEVQNSFEKTALKSMSEAGENSPSQHCLWFEDQGDGSTPIGMAAKEYVSKSLPWLLNLPGLDATSHLEHQEVDQKTPLWHAVESGCEANVRLLLGRGVCVDAPSHRGLTALDHACELMEDPTLSDRQLVVRHSVVELLQAAHAVRVASRAIDGVLSNASKSSLAP